MKFQKQVFFVGQVTNCPKVFPACLYDERTVNHHFGQPCPDFTRQVQFQGEEGIDAGGVAKAGIEHEDGPIFVWEKR